MIKIKLKKFKSHLNPIITSVFRTIFILAFCYVLLYPLIFIAVGMFKAPSNFSDPTVNWVPKEFTLINLERAFEALNFKESLKNTFFYEMIAAFIEVCSCAVAAYGLARFEFPYKKVLILFMFLTILIPIQMTIIPTLINYKSLDVLGILSLFYKLTGADLRVNILDTGFAFWIPSLFAVGLRGGLFIFIYMQFFKGLPKELEEAAWIDGASPIKTFIRVIIPSSGVVIMTVSLFAFVWHWNDNYLALMYTSGNRTLSVMISRVFAQLSIQGFHEASSEATGAALAACFLIIIIPLIVYMIVQRWFVQSIDRVGIVG